MIYRYPLQSPGTDEPEHWTADNGESAIDSVDIKVAVVIPVLDDYEALEALIDNLRTQIDGPEEIVVVDAGGNAELEQSCPGRSIIYRTCRPGRGFQLNSGAEFSTGDVLLFLHADTSPPASAFPAIRQAISAGTAGGFFRFRFAGKSAWYKSLLERCIAFRASVGIPYGDQGIFMTRAAFNSAGRYQDIPLFEEVRLVRNVRRIGRFVALKAPIEVSARRWERDGWLRRTVENRCLALAYILGVSPSILARNYRPFDRKQTLKCQ